VNAPPAERLAGLRLALGTFTVLPVRAGRVDRPAAGTAMLWAPGVGAALGGVLALVLVAGEHLFPAGVGSLLTAAIAVGLAALFTRGLHLDGLADTVDGLGCYGDQQRALSVMGSPEIGPFGVVALVCVLLLDVTALTVALTAGRGLTAVVVALATGRLAVTWACTPRTPAARPDGLGALVAGTTKASVAAVLTVAIACAASLLAIIDGSHPVADVARAVVAVVLPLTIAHALRWHAVRRFGGITGDVLGALVEVTSAVSLVVMAVGAH
jgi:adenosylcobinamide-GDP ribazoletransferase